MTKIYLAAPLFSAAEKEYNSELARKLEFRFTVFLPQRDGGLLSRLVADGMDPWAAKRLVFANDVHAITQADLVLAVLDGRIIDEGVAVELGIAYAKEKCCWALKTDIRSLAWFGDNPMVEAILSRVFNSEAELLSAIAEELGGQPKTGTGF